MHSFLTPNRCPVPRTMSKSFMANSLNTIITKPNTTVTIITIDIPQTQYLMKWCCVNFVLYIFSIFVDSTQCYQQLLGNLFSAKINPLFYHSPHTYGCHCIYQITNHFYTIHNKLWKPFRIRFNKLSFSHKNHAFR